MARTTFSSPTIAKEMKRSYGASAKVVQIQMHHENSVKKFVMEIEEDHKRAANSKLRFP